MNRIAIFPYDENFHPFLKYAARQRDYEISQVFSLRGWGYVGKKVALTVSGATEEITIEDAENIYKENATGRFDIFLIIESEHYLDKKYLYQAVEQAALLKKAVWVLKDLPEEQVDAVDKICKKHGVDLKFVLTSDNDSIASDDVEILYGIDVPIVAVAGMGEKTNKVELQLALFLLLKKNDYKVAWISSRKEAVLFGGQPFPFFMFDEKLSEKKKILMYNHYLKWIEQSEHPDVVLIGIPGGVMPDSKKQVGYFGITAFEILNAVNPDYFIMSLYCGNIGKDYIDELRNVMKYKFNVEVDSFYMSSTEQDAYSLDKINPVEYILLNQAIVVQKVVELDYSEVPLYTDSTKDGLYGNMINKLGGYSDFQAL